MVFFQPVMAIFMAITMRRGKWYIGAAAYAVMSALPLLLADAGKGLASPSAARADSG